MSSHNENRNRLREIKKEEHKKLLKYTALLEKNITYLKKTAKVVSLKEFKKLAEEKAMLTNKLKDYKLGSNEVQNTSVTIFNKPGRITLRLIKFNRAS